MGVDMVSHAENPNVTRRARDFYAIYCASSGGKNYQGLDCPAWENLTVAVRGHWYTVALRSLQLTVDREPGDCGFERRVEPNDYVTDHLAEGALATWKKYSGIEETTP